MKQHWPERAMPLGLWLAVGAHLSVAAAAVTTTAAATAAVGVAARAAAAHLPQQPRSEEGVTADTRSRRLHWLCLTSGRLHS